MSLLLDRTPPLFAEYGLPARGLSAATARLLSPVSRIAAVDEPSSDWPGLGLGWLYRRVETRTGGPPFGIGRIAVRNGSQNHILA